MDYTKALIAGMLGTSLNDLISTPLETEVTGIEKWELTKISALVYQLKIWEKNGGPRYFNIRLSEMQ